MTDCTSQDAYITCNFVVANLTVCKFRTVVEVLRQRLGTLRDGATATATMWIVRALQCERAADSVMVPSVEADLFYFNSCCVCRDAASMIRSSKRGWCSCPRTVLNIILETRVLNDFIPYRKS
jgi:hypothetical protein